MAPGRGPAPPPPPPPPPPGAPPPTAPAPAPLLPLALLLLLAARAALGAPDWSDCPAACRCKWVSGKKTAVCREAGFTAVPSHLNPEMQVLDLGGNDIPYLTKDAFHSAGLPNLQRIFLRGAGVREVHRDAFKDLLILVEVDLADNAISSLHPDTFTGNTRLRELLLSGNPLTELRDAQFPPLPHLRTLELEGCQLRRVHRDAFTNLAQLEKLNMRANQLTQLSERVFEPLARLKTLALDGNPWRCDCELRGFRSWLLASNLYSLPLTCADAGPGNAAAAAGIAGRFWEDVSPVDFACAPEVSLGEHMVQEEVGGNVTFRCHARGDPEPEVAWLFNGRPVGAGNASNPDLVFLIEEERAGRDKWTNLSIFNVSEAEAGEYACVARNGRGWAARNVSLLLPQVIAATTLSNPDGWLLWAGLVAAGAAALCSALLTVVCSCCVCGRQRRRRKHHRRKGKLKGSVSFTEQEKKLLDVSITTTERPSGAGSCEGLGGSQPDMELLEQAQALPLELGEPPVHITIESHHGAPEAPGAAAAAAAAYPGALTVFPPPPEFSTSILPAGAYGNIFISVSVSQEPVGAAAAAAAAAAADQRYPDLLDIPHRGGVKGLGAAAAVSVAAGPDVPAYPPLAPRPLGAGASAAAAAAAAASVAPYATLPRRQAARKDPEPVGLRAALGVAAAAAPHYDNMGPRVTAGGSSTLSLPDSTLAEDLPIPPPPLPPLCTPLPAEYVAL